MEIEQQFQAILDDRVTRGLEPTGGNAEDTIGFMAQGKLAKKKTWHKGRFYQEMTNFYAHTDRQRIWTAPTIELSDRVGRGLRKSLSRGGTVALSPLKEQQSENVNSPLGSPTRSPGRGRLDRAGTTEGLSSPVGKLASTDFGLP